MIQLCLIYLHAISLVGTHGLNRAGSGPTRMGHHKPCVLRVRPIPTRLRTLARSTMAMLPLWQRSLALLDRQR